MQKIAPAFIKAKQEFGPALKDRVNPAFKSKYADLGACIDAVDEALLNNGIAMMQETSLDDTGVTVETIFIHSSGETLRSGKLHVPASKQDPQGYGSALTYARRYSLMAACGIAPEDDDGNAATPPKKEHTPPPVSITALIKGMEATRSMESLQIAFANAWKQSSQNADVKAHYDTLKMKYATTEADHGKS